MAYHKTLLLMRRTMDDWKRELRVMIAANTDEIAEVRRELDKFRMSIHHPRVEDPGKSSKPLKIPPKPEVMS